MDVMGDDRQPAWLGRPDSLGGPAGIDGRSENRTLLVAVGCLDAAGLQAVRYSAVVPARQRVAVHVAIDDERADRLARAWMDAYLLSELRLEIVDSVGSVAETLAVVACNRLNAGAAQVVVLATRRHRSRPFGREQTGDVIARELSRVRGALPVLLDIAATTH
jgi:hypothetical protein